MSGLNLDKNCVALGFRVLPPLKNINKKLLTGGGNILSALSLVKSVVFVNIGCSLRKLLTAQISLRKSPRGAYFKIDLEKAYLIKGGTYCKIDRKDNEKKDCLA